MKNFLLTLLMLFTSIQLFAQNYWRETLTSPTNNVDFGNTCIAINAESTLYIGTLNSGVYRSFDNGATWEQCLLLNDATVVKIICKNENEVFVAAATQVYYSADKGNTWIKNNLLSKYTITDIELLPNGKLIASTAEIVDFAGGKYEFIGDGVYMSANNGADWEKINTGLLYNNAITNLAISKKGIMVASMASFTSGQSGVYYSLDEGKHWTILPKIRFKGSRTGAEYSPQDMYEIHCLEFDKDDNIYVSFQGSGGNFAIEGGFYTNISKAIASDYWKPLHVNALGFEWQFHPFYSIYFAQKQEHVYTSLHTYSSTSFGGPYVDKARLSSTKRVVSGVLPVRNSYLKMLFVENSKGRIYGVQYLDHRVYFTDSSAQVNTGLEQVNSGKVSIYPNPSTSYVKIELENAEENLSKVELYNLQGQLMQSETELVNSQFIFDINNLIEGMYILKIQTDKAIYSKSISIKK